MPKGLQMNRILGGAPNSGGMKAYRVANGYATALAVGDPVALSNGTVVKYTAGNKILGVCQGFQWIGADNVPTFAPVLPAATSSMGTITEDNRPICFVTDNPNQTYTIDARVSLAVSATNVGQVYTLSLAGGVTGGNSTVVLEAIATSVDQGAVRVIGLTTLPGNSYNVSGNTVEVMLVNHIYNV